MSESNGTKVKKVKEKALNPKTLWEILRQETKFKIYGYLNVYRELGLPELTKRIGKSKSTVHEHLKNLKEWGYINERAESDKDSNSNLKKKFYSWNKNADYACCTWDKDEKLDEEKSRQKIDTWRSFVSYNQNIMDNYKKFLDKLDDELDKGNTEEVISILEEINTNKTKPRPFHSVAFYTPDNAMKIYEKIYELYQDIPDEERSEADESPYYGGFWLLPIKKILDYLYKK